MTSAAPAGLEAIVANQAAGGAPPALAEEPAEDQQQGIHKKQSGMKPPQPIPGMLNKEMAEAAAVKFKEKEKDIQKACADIDAGKKPGEEEAKTGCSCIIL